MTTTTFEHEEFCLPHPGEDAPRVETSAASRYDEQGFVVGTVQVRRYMDCGAATYDGAQRSA